MNNFGLQLYSIRTAAENDLIGTLEKIAEMGYQGAQFAGFYGLDSNMVRERMGSLKIKPAGAHVQIDQLESNLDDVKRYHDTIDNELIICPNLPEEMRSSREDYERIAEKLNGIGCQLKKSGFRLGYHNHAFEFDEFQGKTGFDIIYEQTDPEYLKMELDCYWVAHAGHDPIQIIKKHADRCVSLHIKDIKESEGKQISTELGTGTLPLSDYIQAGLEHNVDWLVAEQEHFAKDPLTSAKENAEFIKQMI